MTRHAARTNYDYTDTITQTYIHKYIHMLPLRLVEDAQCVGINSHLYFRQFETEFRRYYLKYTIALIRVLAESVISFPIYRVIKKFSWQP
jgi:hypothetical protein